MKRKYEEEKFPEILEHIQSGRYSVKPPTDPKCTQKITWDIMRFIYDDSEKVLPDFFFCSRCAKIFNLKLCDNGKTLKRHAEKCAMREKITEFFVPEMTQPQNKKIKLVDKQLMKDAAMEFLIRDTRPISSISGEGLCTLISKATYIGAKYGHLTTDAIEKTNLLPSRQTVILIII